VARPPLPLETHGEIRKTVVNGKPTAIAYYRDSDGVTRKAQRTGRTKEIAANLLRETLRDRLAPSNEYLTRESTLTELAEQWMSDVRNSKRAAATVERYESTVRAHVNKAVGSVRIREATVPRMQRVITRVAEASGPAQARMLGVVFTGMFGLAVRHGAAEANVGSSLLLPAAERTEVRAPSIEDIRALRVALQAYDAKPAYRGDSIRDLADIGDMLIGTGARIGEVLALRWQDVDHEARRVTITGTVTRIRGEGIHRQSIPKSVSSNRSLIYPQFVADMLLARRVDAYSDWVFPSANGTLRWPENVRQQWGVAVTGTAVEWITTKACRKAVATLLRETDGLDAAKDQLGHADSGVTSRHYVERQLERPDRSAMLDVFAQNSE
jgi:integrase